MRFPQVPRMPRMSPFRTVLMGTGCLAAVVLALVAVSNRFADAPVAQTIEVPETEVAGLDAGSTLEGAQDAAADAAPADAVPTVSAVIDRPMPYVPGTELVDYDKVVVTGRKVPNAKPFALQATKPIVRETLTVTAKASPTAPAFPDGVGPTAGPPIAPAIISALAEPPAAEATPAELHAAPAAAPVVVLPPLRRAPATAVAKPAKPAAAKPVVVTDAKSAKLAKAGKAAKIEPAKSAKGKAVEATGKGKAAAKPAPKSNAKPTAGGQKIVSQR